MMTKTSKNKWKSFKKTLRRMEKGVSMEHQNPYPMGCCQKEAQSWKEVLEGKFEFELTYYIYCISF